MNKEPKINYVDNSNNFVGLRLNKEEIEIYVPSVFRVEENYKKDLLFFLNSISLAKTIEKEKISSGSKDKSIWPLESYLWIIRDYLENGFYFNREKTYSDSYNGKIEWKKTLKNLPIYSNGNIIYDKLVTSKMSASDDLIAQIYRLCLKLSIDRIGWLYNFNYFVDVQQIASVSEMISVINKEIASTFDDIKKLRYKHLLKILKNVEGDNVISSASTYGINNYYYVFETMVDMFFDGIKVEKTKYNPTGYWMLNNQEKRIASSLRPDTIIERNDAIYILDAKMYKYGFTHSPTDLPETQSIQKQITYGDYVSNNSRIEKIRNAFILPYNKELVSFKYDNNVVPISERNLVYFGYAFADWRDNFGSVDYDRIYTYGIDFNYLLRNYRHSDERVILDFCESIESLIDKANT